MGNAKNIGSINYIHSALVPLFLFIRDERRSSWLFSFKFADADDFPPSTAHVIGAESRGPGISGALGISWLTNWSSDPYLHLSR